MRLIVPFFKNIRLFFFRYFQLFFKSTTTPILIEYRVLNDIKNQFYVELEIKLKYALFIIIDDNIIPVLSDSHQIKARIPLRKDQKEIEIKAKGIFGSITKKLAVPQKNKVEFKTITFGRIGKIVDKKIPGVKIIPSKRMSDIFDSKQLKIRNLEAKSISNGIHPIQMNMKLKRQIEKFEIRNHTSEIELKINKNTIHEK